MDRKRPTSKMPLLQLCHIAKPYSYKADAYTRLPPQSAVIEVDVAELVSEYQIEMNLTLCPPECFPADIIVVGHEETIHRAWSETEILPREQWPGTQVCHCGANCTYLRCGSYRQGPDGTREPTEFFRWFCAPCNAKAAVIEYLTLVPTEFHVAEPANLVGPGRADGTFDGDDK